MFAVIVNTLAITVAVFIGLLLRKGLPEHISSSIIKALGLCTVVIGVQGAIKEDNILIMIISVVIGLTVGEALDADGRVNRFTDRILKKGSPKANSSRLTEAFITSCLIMNVGAMVIVGSLDAGLRADYTMLYTKSLLDFISGIMMTAAMGVGVLGSAIFTFFFQGSIVLLAEYLAPYLFAHPVGGTYSFGNIWLFRDKLSFMDYGEVLLLCIMRKSRNRTPSIIFMNLMDGILKLMKKLIPLAQQY